jgi:AcrR family transcriptional regulator
MAGMATARTGTTDPQPRPGLRERKKAKTRASIQEHALKLFHRQGYAETTMEQIAEAAEVSPTTVYRYFPTKPDLVIYDDLDEPMIAALRDQPADMSSLEAMRQAITTVFGGSLGQQLEVQRQRADLIRDVPELRAAMIDEFARTLRLMASAIAQRAGATADYEEVLALAGAVLGLTLAAWLASEGDDWTTHFLERVDKGIRLLETGFNL